MYMANWFFRNHSLKSLPRNIDSCGRKEGRKWKKGRKEVKVAQSCPTLCNPMDYTVHGILQARILEWVAFPFYRGSSQPRDQTQVSCMAGGLFTSWAKREAQIAVELAHKTTGMLMGRVRLIHWFFLSLYKHHISELLQTSDEGPRSRDPVHYSAHAVFLP